MEVAAVIIDSIMGLIGNTPVAELYAGDTVEVFVKFEGNNPSGSVFDRLLMSATFTGGRIEVRQHDQLAAAIALTAGSLGLPLTLFTNSPTSNSARMAAAFGATVAHSTENEPMYVGIELEPQKALTSLVEECAAVRGQDRSLIVVIPPVVPLIGAANGPDTIELIAGSVYVPLLRPDPAAGRRLARRGLLMDDLSATCAEWATQFGTRRPCTTAIAIAACDGAITKHLNEAIIARRGDTCTPIS